jgi:hypothetical protein
MSQGYWTSGLFTSNSLKHSFYEIVGARFVQGSHETNRIGRRSHEFPFTIGVTRSI